MASKLGELVRETRQQQDIGVRELARRIDKSGSAIVRIEQDDPPPSVAEETLRSIANELDLNPDRLITLAGKTPSDVKPDDEEEAALFRKVKRLDDEQREDIFEVLEHLRDENGET